MKNLIRLMTVIATVSTIILYTQFFTFASSAENNSNTDTFSSASSENLSSSIGIRTAEELKSINPSGRYHLISDIDLSQINWKPIKGFTGIFDGNGYEIKGLTSTTYGLFSTVGTGAIIKNVKLTNVHIMSKYRTIGAVVSIVNASAKNVIIDNCFVSGLVAACRTKYGLDKTSTSGAIVGKNNSASSLISNCFTNAVVCSERQVGGIVGINKGTVQNCAFCGEMENSHNIYELAVNQNNDMDDSYSYLYACGGICGFNYGAIINCLGNYTDHSSAKYNGGIVGANMKNGSVKKCVNLTTILFDDYMNTGFIAGYAAVKSSIEDCYTIEPTNTTTLDNIGKTSGKFDIAVISSDNLRLLSSFPQLKGGWEIVNNIPMLTSLTGFLNQDKIYTIKSGKIVQV